MSAVSAFLETDPLPGSPEFERRHPSVRSEAVQTSAALTVNLADVEPQKVDWLWSGWVPQARLSLVIGHAGQGKSWLTLALAAAVSRGWPLPGDDRTRAPRGVLLIGAEDGLADTVRPRLDALGANVRQIVALEGVTTDRGERGFLLSDVGPLEELLAAGDYGLVVIDPLTAFAGGADSYKDAEVRGLLAPLAQLAERYGAAIVGVMHLRKGQADTALQRASGSIAWGAAARSVFAVGTDPQAEDGTTERHVLPVKHNLAPAPEGVTFSLEAGRFTWGGRSSLSARQLMAATGPDVEDGALGDAATVLEAILADGPLPAREAARQAREAGVSDASLRRARGSLGVRVERRGFGPGGRWEWSLPVSIDAQATEPPRDHGRIDAQSELLSTYGPNEHLWRPDPPANSDGPTLAQTLKVFPAAQLVRTTPPAPLPVAANGRSDTGQPWDDGLWASLEAEGGSLA